MSALWARGGWVAALLLVLLILLTPSGGYRPAEPTRVLSPTSRADIVAVSFVDRTLSSGLTFSHLQGGDYLSGLNETLGGGACAFDFDNDGWVDLFLVNGSGETKYYGAQQWWHLPKGHALFRNLGNGQFEDVSRKAGFTRQSWGMGCTTGDLDNDGNDDLLITNDGANLLYRNNGNGTFSDVSGSSGLGGTDWSTSAAIADYDGDGFLDIYVVNYLQYKKGARTYEAGRQYGGPNQAAFDATAYPGAPNRLYHNKGHFQFEDMTTAAGVADAKGRGLAALWLDIDQQHGPDLLVLNDAGYPNALFINQGKGRFEERAEAYKLNNGPGNRGVAAGDIYNDGRLALAMSSPARQTLKVYLPDSKGELVVYTDEARRLGIGTEEQADLSGWAIGLQDFNNDGRLDLFSVNGRVTPDPDTQKLPQGQQKRLWLNPGAAPFLLAATSHSPLADNQSGRGAVFADFDNDGDIDVYVAHNNDLGQLLINQVSGQHWIGLDLRRKDRSRNVIGARVSLRTAGGTQTRVVTSTGFLSDSDRRVVFGLGGETSIKQLKVTWPDGAIDTWSDLAPDRYYSLIEDSSSLKPYTANIQTARASSAVERFNKLEPEQRTNLLKWLIAARGIDTTRGLLEAAMRDPDESVRKATVELLAQHPGRTALPLLIDTLSDQSPSIRGAAVAAISKHEDETSIRWLLRSFDDPDPEVRRAIADVFAFWYREEEAVVYRKYLALPYLIRRLNDPDKSVRIAAIRALGNAERYRAVQPLISVLDEKDAELQAEAARALGLIRETEAIAPLRTLFRNAAADPVARAHALIALKRLGEPGSELQLKKLLDHQNSFNSALSIAQAIITDEDDGVVLNLKTLGQYVVQAVGQKLNRDPKWTDQASAAGAIPVLASIKTRLAQGMLRRFTVSQKTDLRQLAYAALSPSIEPVVRKVLMQGLSDSSPDVRRSVLKTLARTRLPIDGKRLQALLADDALRDDTLRLLIAQPDASYASPLQHIMRNPNTDTRTLAAALESASVLSAPEKTLPNQEIFRSNDATLRRAAFLYQASRWPSTGSLAAPPAELTRALSDPEPGVRHVALEALLSRNEPWALTTIESLLLGSRTDGETKRALCAKLGRRPSQQVRDVNLLIRFSRFRHDPGHQAAFERLTQLSHPAVDAFLLGVVTEKTESLPRRYQAADAIFPRHPDKVLAALW